MNYKFARAAHHAIFSDTNMLGRHEEGRAVAMSREVAEQIAHLLNTQNQLTVPYTAARVLEHDRYITRHDESGKVIGAVEVKKVQWYQCEIDHVSVDPGFQRKGVGSG